MRLGRPMPPVDLTDGQREQLQALTASRAFPHGLVRRARIVLLAADGATNMAIAKTLHLSKAGCGKPPIWGSPQRLSRTPRFQDVGEPFAGSRVGSMGPRRKSQTINGLSFPLKKREGAGSTDPRPSPTTIVITMDEHTNCSNSPEPDRFSATC